MKKLLYLLLLMLPLTMLCACDDDENLDGPIGYPWNANLRLDFYYADGTPQEGLTPDEAPDEAFKIKVTIETCEKDTFNRWPVDYKGNSMYLNIGGWSTDQHPGHENNVTFKIGIKSRDLFNSDDTMNINIVCDSRLIVLKPYAPVKSVTSDDLTVSSTLEYEKAEWYDGDTTFLVPIKVILPEKE